MKRFNAVMVDLNMNPQELALATVPWVQERLAGEGVDFAFHMCKTKEDLARYAADADVVWVASGRPVVNAENIDVLKACGAIVRGGLGYENIPVAEATERGILVVTTPEFVEPVAEHAVTLLLATGRQIPRHDRLVHTGHWDRSMVGPGHLLAGARVGFVGLGRIPRTMLRKLAGFEMNFLAYDPYVSAETMRELGVQKVELDELLKTADFVSLHCALTEETEHMIGERELRLMQPEAVLINTARGKVVDEGALYRALKEGWIAAAGLDVIEKEPPDPDNPLLQLENVFITPHMAAYMHLFPKLQFDAGIDKIVDLAHGRWPKSVVNRVGLKPRWDLE